MVLPTIASFGQNQNQFNIQGKVDLYFDAVADPYRWLEDDRSAETAVWLKENKVTYGYLNQIPSRCIKTAWRNYGIKNRALLRKEISPTTLRMMDCKKSISKKTLLARKRFS
jgi:hypothetical protein